MPHVPSGPVVKEAPGCFGVPFAMILSQIINYYQIITIAGSLYKVFFDNIYQIITRTLFQIYQSTTFPTDQHLFGICVIWGCRDPLRQRAQCLYWRSAAAHGHVLLAACHLSHISRFVGRNPYLQWGYVYLLNTSLCHTYVYVIYIYIYINGICIYRWICTHLT